MLQQLRTVNRFVSLTPNDPDDSDTDTEPTEPRTVDKPHDDGSAVSDDTVPTSKQGLSLSCVLVCLFVCLFPFLVCFVFDGIAHWTVYWSITSAFEAIDG